MYVLLVGWIFGIFLYLKIAMEAAFYDGVTVLGALLMAIMAGLFISVLTMFYVVRLARLDATLVGDRRPLSRVVKATAPPLVIGLAAFIVVCMLIAFGFSDDLSSDIGDLSPFSYRGTQGRFMTFAILVCIPILFHYATVLFTERFRDS